jgi:hypothetical protein
MLGNAEASRWAHRAESEATAALNAELAKVGYIEVGSIRANSENLSSSLGTLYYIGTGLVVMMAVTGSLKVIGLPIDLDTIVGIVAFWVAPIVILERFKGVDKGIDRLAGSETTTRQRQAANELEGWAKSLSALVVHIGGPTPRLQAPQ